jgi:hypothetical protein
MKKLDLIILTPALNRSELHTLCLAPIIKLVSSLNVKWLINIDSVGPESVDITESNLRSILTSPNIDLEIFKSKQPCFYSAVKSLTYEAEAYLDETEFGVFYLEDDWPVKINFDTINFKLFLQETKITDLTYISFQKNEFPNQLNFRPSLYSKHMFKINFIGGFNANVYEPRDPELTCADAAWIDAEGTRLECIQPNRILNYNWFYGPEVGKKWVSDVLKKHKWNKYNKGTGHDPMNNLTYF